MSANNNDRISHPHSKPIEIPNAGAGPHHHSRRSVSFSPSSFSSSSGDDYSPPLRTPVDPISSSPNVRTQVPASPQASTSPILSYFFSSPTKSNAASAVLSPTSPSAVFGSLGRSAAAPANGRAAEPIAEETVDGAEAFAHHARRMSASASVAPWPPSASRFIQPSTQEQHERGQSLLRRLSLGSALVRVCILKLLSVYFCQDANAYIYLIQPQIANPTAQQNTPTVLAPAAQIPARTASPAAVAEKRKRRATTLGAPADGANRRRAPSPMGERILKGHFDGFN